MDEDQRRDLLRRAEDEVRRVSREHGRDSPQARAERQRQLGLERTTAAKLGLPYAERVDLGVTWDADTPMPVLLSSLRTFVAFYLSVRDPVFDGTNPRVRDPQADHGIGIVEFKRATSIKIGSPNDEVLRGHPLWGSGLEFYSAHEVKNSPWITELIEVDRAHERFDESQWTGRRHFMLTFHDETLECVAKWTICMASAGKPRYSSRRWHPGPCARALALAAAFGLDRWRGSWTSEGGNQNPAVRNPQVASVAGRS